MSGLETNQYYLYTETNNGGLQRIFCEYCSDDIFEDDEHVTRFRCICCGYAISTRVSVEITHKADVYTKEKVKVTK